MRTGSRNGLFAALMQGMVKFAGKSNKNGTHYPKPWKPKFKTSELEQIRDPRNTKREREAFVKQFRAKHFEKEQPTY